MTIMKLHDYINELNATVIRSGRKHTITHVDGQKLAEPKSYSTKREMLGDLKDWWDNGWQQ